MADPLRARTPSIYLVQPKFPPSYWGMEHFMELTPHDAVFPPLGLLTLAGLTPPDFPITLCDENAGEQIDFDTDAEIVGITGYIIQIKRVFEIADEFRRRGKTVVIGGPMANLLPHECRMHCDVLFEGEAEYTWPRFLKEYAAGKHADHYTEEEKIHMPDSPPPRLDAAEQAVRPRHRPVYPRLSVHLRVLRHHRDVRPQDAVQAGRAGAQGDPGVAPPRGGAGVLRRRQLRRQPRLRQGTAQGDHRVEPQAAAPAVVLHPGQHRHGPRRRAARPLRDANFISVFIGIESPRKESLAETKKLQNERIDLVEALHKIQSYNLFISAGMIVGFDKDDVSIFDEQYQFLQKAEIPMAMLSVLLAVPEDAAVQAAPGGRPAARPSTRPGRTARTTSAPPAGPTSTRC